MKNSLSKLTLLFTFVICVALAPGCGARPAESSLENQVEQGASSRQSGPVEMEQEKTSSYTDIAMWAYWAEGEDKEVDCFLVCPTVFFGKDGVYNMALDDEKTLQSFVGALNMEMGIYEESCRMFAPFYRQAGMNVFTLEDAQAQPYFELAYQDVKSAFLAYLEQENAGRPIVLAGFSQGADMCLRLMKDVFSDETLREQLVACYAIGWRVTQQDLEAFPHLAVAQAEADTGVIISFNSESKAVTSSLMVPEQTLGINPLNWRTDSTYADPAQNKGACFTNYDGKVVREAPGLTGAYLDSKRGTLKVDDSITPEEYPPGLDLFPKGVYHLYDYQFFYRNLQENVAKRTAAYLELEQPSAKAA